jgi:hypothetical protein
MRVLVKFFLALVISLIVFGFASNGQAQTKGSPPVITFSYAQEKIR